MADESLPAVPSESPDQAVTGSPETQSDQAPAEQPAETTNDLSQIPEEFRPLVEARIKEIEEKEKSLTADYTKKTQEIADIRRKADAFEEFRPLIEAQLNNLGQPKEQAPAKKLTGEEILLGILDKGEDYLDQLVNDRAERLVQSRIEPLTQGQAQAQAEAEIARLSAKYPDFMEHADQVASLIEEHGESLSPEMAYKIATYEKAYSKGMSEAGRANDARVQAAAAAPKATASPATSQPIRNIRDAFEAAKRQAGR